jgi:hypothetical protein
MKQCEQMLLFLLIYFDKTMEADTIFELCLKKIKDIFNHKNYHYFFTILILMYSYLVKKKLYIICRLY